MSSDKECMSGNAFDGDLDPNPEINQIFGDAKEVAKDVEIK